MNVIKFKSGYELEITYQMFISLNKLINGIGTLDNLQSLYNEQNELYCLISLDDISHIV